MTAAEPRAEYDAPFIMGSTWRIHDPARPHPRQVEPGTTGTPEHAGMPPEDAIVLLDGRNLSGWVHVETGQPAQWRLDPRGFVEVAPGTGDIQTKAEIGDCQLHVEWAARPEAEGERTRSNSGVFMMGRYEIQVLDCYKWPSSNADQTTAGIYGQYPPLVNACRRPGEWQTFDLVWIAPRFDGEKLVSPAYLTLFFNGVLVHHHQQVNGPTGHFLVAPYEPHPPVGPVRLQDHGHPVRFRSIWCRPL
jgi:hypothetical protein